MSGDRDRASAVAALRKPTVPAWAVNQLARRRARDVDLLLDAGHRLIEEQHAGRSGRRIEQANARQRSIIEKLLVEAREILGPRASDQTVRVVAETLRAASLMQDGRELLARGRLTEPLTTTGWELLVANPPPAGGRPARGRSRPGNGTAALAAARKELREADRERDEAERRLRVAGSGEQTARLALERARAHLQAEKQALARAEKRVAAAKRTLDRLDDARQ